MQTTLALSFSESVATITLQAPEGKPPTLDHSVMDAMESALAEIESRSPSLAAVLLRSASPRFFCAGANLNVMETISAQTISAWVRRGHVLMNRLEALPLPVLAIVQGYAMGGGLELAMACDLIYASKDARFGQSEAKLGLVTGWGGCYRLSRRVGLARAKELAFTGRIFDGVEAQAMGLTTWCGPVDQLESAVKTFVDAVTANSRTALRETKAILATCDTTTIEENADVEATASERCLMEGDAPVRLRDFFAARRSRISRAH